MNAKMGTQREEQFRKLMATEGVHLVRPTVAFVFKWTRYRPDWYDPATGIYYEVIGSRQRFHGMVPLLDLMALVHPSIVLRVFTTAGIRVRPKQEELEERVMRLPHGHAVLLRMREQDWRAKDLAASLGIGPGYFSQMLAGKVRAEGWIAEKLHAFAEHRQIPMHKTRWPKHRLSCSQLCLDVMELYADGVGTPRIAQLLHIGASRAQEILRLHGVKTRPVGYYKGAARPVYERIGAST